MFCSFKSCGYYLRAKALTYEGGHANLHQCAALMLRLFTGASLCNNSRFASVIFLVAKNTVVDWQSRFDQLDCMNHLFSMFQSEFAAKIIHSTNAEDNVTSTCTGSAFHTPVRCTRKRDLFTPEKMLTRVHRHRSGHFDVQTIYDLGRRI